VSAVGVLGIVALCAYSAIVGPRAIDTIPEVLAAPLASDGVELRLGSDVKVVGVDARGFRVAQRGQQITVRVPPDVHRGWSNGDRPWRVGEFVSMRAVYRADEGGYLVLRELHQHGGRSLKVWVSAVALLVVAGAVVREPHA
jgi:hypothetical protein